MSDTSSSFCSFTLFSNSNRCNWNWRSYSFRCCQANSTSSRNPELIFSNWLRITPPIIFFSLITWSNSDFNQSLWTSMFCTEVFNCEITKSFSWYFANTSSSFLSLSSLNSFNRFRRLSITPSFWAMASSKLLRNSNNELFFFDKALL